ncbi:MAG: hypothetical protein A2W19_06755 [Spirochaetes bacterium RBG_16_49_21]|nr:MAG: hypothetical protein A2W19_06755 [Spirochaetes bacterium RBG_16_49_21]
MSYLLDTCVISELTKQKPDGRVLKWFNQCEEDQMYISCLTIGELHYGIGILPESKKKNDLLVWFNDFQEVYKDATLPITDNICIRWGKERARRKHRGIHIPVIDGLIACTASEHNYILVTRNISDFANMTVQILNPWK